MTTQRSVPFIRSSLAALLASAVFTGSLSYAADAFPKGSYVSGPYTLEFKGKGKFRVLKSPYPLVEGEYKVSGDQIQFTDKSGPFACSGAGQASGTYRWKLEEGNLKLSKIEDKCSDRSNSFAGPPWKRR